MKQKKNNGMFYGLRLCLKGVLLLAVLLFLCGGRALAMTAAESTARLQLEYICAWMSLAAYGDRAGMLAREELEASGWVIDRVHEELDAADAKYLVATRREPTDAPLYLVTVTGTENMKDVKLDLSFKQVYFAGSSPEEFAEMTNKQTLKDSDPQVHNGFDTYTRQAFFQAERGQRSIGEQLRDLLLDKPQARVVLTGHSLGGAVAILLGQRLLDMGAPADRLSVITFGAPPVGNKAFAEHASALNLERIVVVKDPVVKLPAIKAMGLVHCGTLMELVRSSSSRRFRHAMSGYMDAVLKLYYDSGLGEGERPEWLSAEERVPASVYLVQSVSLPELIAEDEPYLRQATADLISRQFSRVVTGEPGSLREICARAQKAGCRYIIAQEYTAERRRDKDYEFSLLLTETVYGSDGSVLAVQSFTTGTNQMPPIGAALYNEVQGKELREGVIRP